MEKNKISCLIHTYNSEKYLEWCLKSVLWCDEIVIIDMYSSDRTLEIAQKYKTKVFFHEYTGYVEPARAFGVSKCSYGWILIVDSDEIVTPELSDKLRKIAEQDQFDVVLIPRINLIFGKVMLGGGWGYNQDLQPRFFKKNYINFLPQIHDGYRIAPTARIGKIKNSRESIIHFNYHSVYQFIQKLNTYTDFEALNKKKYYKKGSISMIHYFLRTFFGHFLFLKGYKDGMHGLYLSLAMAFYKVTAIAKANFDVEEECFKIYEKLAKDIIEYQMGIKCEP